MRNLGRPLMLAGILSLAAITAAAAEERQSWLRACAADVKQHCANVQRGEGALKACITANFDSFSPACRQSVMSRVKLVHACREPVIRRCGATARAGGRLDSCIKANFWRLGTSCQTAIFGYKYAQLRRSLSRRL